MIGNAPFGLSREQIAKMGPVQSVPQGKDPAVERQVIERQISSLRDIAELHNVPKLVEYLKERHAVSLRDLLTARGDDARREKQAAAQAYARIYSDIVTATKQIASLTERLESLRTK